MQMEKWKRGMAAVLLVFGLAFCNLLFKAYMEGKFNSAETLRDYVAGFGLFAPLVLTAIQAAQVVLPVVPGFLGCAAGAVLFGWAGGFLCNYIGISAGSVIAFLLARKYGRALVDRIFPGKQHEKWARWAAQSRSYTVVLLLGMILPLFPDDYFCYLTGITKMRARKFIAIILVGKPWCILAYSLIFAAAAS